jgi:hypothetical protein
MVAGQGMIDMEALLHLLLVGIGKDVYPKIDFTIIRIVHKKMRI